MGSVGIGSALRPFDIGDAVSSQGPVVRRARGFTLIELLVVVAVVSILAALLLPMVQEGLNAATATACKSGLRQIGMALQSYRQDFRRIFPRWGQARWPGDTSHGGSNGGHLLMPSALFHRYLDQESEVWICPSDPTGQSRGTAWWVCSYQVNGNLNSLPDHKIRRTSAVVTVADCWDDWGWFEFPDTDPGGSDAPYKIPHHEAYNRHSNGMNCLFFDAHVEWRRPGHTCEADFTPKPLQ